MSQSINLYNQLAKNKLFSKTINFDLKRIKSVLKKIDHPERKLKNVINIIGSDGKFSLLTSLQFFIEANKQSASAYISPSLKSIKERFWMGKNFLSHKEIKATIKVIERQKVHLTIFEVLTVIFILNAAKKNNEYNLVEAGALFAKDSTNVFDYPKIQAIVNINKQHLNFLKKKTINEIILQKVGFLSNFTNISDFASEISVDETYEFSLSYDDPNEDQVTMGLTFSIGGNDFSSVQLPWANLDNSGNIILTPTSGNTGDYIVSFIISDDCFTVTESQSFTIRINAWASIIMAKVPDTSLV